MKRRTLIRLAVGAAAIGLVAAYFRVTRDELVYIWFKCDRGNAFSSGPTGTATLEVVETNATSASSVQIPDTYAGSLNDFGVPAWLTVERPPSIVTRMIENLAPPARVACFARTSVVLKRGDVTHWLFVQVPDPGVGAVTMQSARAAVAQSVTLVETYRARDLQRLAAQHVARASD